jgi:hypothetical protein
LRLSLERKKQKKKRMTEDKLRRYTGNKIQQQEEEEAIELTSPGTPTYKRHTRTRLVQLEGTECGTSTSS